LARLVLGLHRRRKSALISTSRCLPALGVPNVNQTVFKVEIEPSKVANLTAPHARAQRNQHNRLEPFAVVDL
jgi:hypothetical protein